MRDGQIRALLRSQLQHEFSDDRSTVVIEELDICGTARIDMAVVNGNLSGYELKSDFDTLRRLPHQMATYARVMDSLTLVVGERHYADAIKVLPDWWGVLVVRSSPQPVLETQRSARSNTGVVAVSLAQLLWREEALDELTRRGLDRGVRSKSRRYIWERLSESVPLDELRAVVRDRLKTREGWRAQPARASDGG